MLGKINLLTQGVSVAGLRLDLIGGLRISSSAGAPVALSAKKARALLAFLALHAGQPQSRDKLAALLWEDRDEAQARTSLRQALAAVRKALADADADIVAADAESVSLPAADVSVDVIDLQNAVADGAAERLEDLAQAAPGALLDGFDPKAPAFDDWMRAERQRVDGLVNDGLSTLLDHHTRGGELERAAHIATLILTRDPLREDVHRALMKVYAQQGRHALALKQYRRCQDVLRNELGVAPDPETQALQRDIEARRRAPAEAPPAAAAPDAIPEPVSEPAPEPPAAPEPAAPTVPAAAASPEKRQATVMFADISGFTDLSAEMDPEDLHELVSRFFTAVDGLVEANGGTVLRHIGDNVMAVFGVPTAHSNDPIRATRTAHEIHEAMPGIASDLGRELRVHIGIASGPVIISSIGGEERVTGDAANLAARLTDMAGPEQTLVDETTRLILADGLEAEDLGAREIKGFRDPLRVFQAGALVEPDSDSRLFPFVGRTAERMQFEGVARSCQATGNGMTVYVRGPAGMGKTRLVGEFEAAAREVGFACHRALVLDFGAARERNALRTLFQSVTRETAARDGETDLSLAEAAARVPVTDQQRIFLNEALIVPNQPEAAKLIEAMDQTARVRGMGEALSELVHWAGAKQPLLLVIEDIHWANKPTLAYLGWLSGLVAEAPAILVITARTETDPIDRA